MIPPTRVASALTTTVLLAATLALAWWGGLDRYASAHTHAALQRALVTFALTRTLNGAISVAQGTELAFEPAGVGVVITAGQILDPLNDLVEQFSTLTLLAVTSLGVQLLLADMFSTPAVNIVLTAAIVAALVAQWSRSQRGVALRSAVLRATTTLVFIRFAIVIAALGTNVVTELYLTPREESSVAALTQTREAIESPNDATGPSAESVDSLLGRLNRFLDDQRQALDIENRLSRLKLDVEAAVQHVVDLIVIYVVETLLLPLAFLVVAWGLVKHAWRRI